MLQPTGYESPAWLRLGEHAVDIDAFMRRAEVNSNLRHPAGVSPAFVFLWTDLEGDPLLLIGAGNPWQWRELRAGLPAQPAPAEEADADRTPPARFEDRIVRNPLGVVDPAQFVRPHLMGALTYGAHRTATVPHRLVVCPAGSHLANTATKRSELERLATLFSSADPTSGLVLPERFFGGTGTSLIVPPAEHASAADHPVFSGQSAAMLPGPETLAAPLPGIRRAPLRPEILVAVLQDVAQTPPRPEIIAALPNAVPAPTAADNRGDGFPDATSRPPKRKRLLRYADLGQRAAEVARRLQPLHATVTGESTLPAIRIATLSRQPARALRVFSGRSGRHPRRLALASVLAALAVGTLHVLSALNVARAGDLRLQLDEMSAELQQARQVAGEVHQLESLLANRASQVLSASSWIALLAALDEARPPGLHLTNVGSAMGSWVDVSGRADSTHEVTQYLSSLAATRTIDGADVTFDPDNGGVVFALRVAIDDTAAEPE